jgi:hypothetical protein
MKRAATFPLGLVSARLRPGAGRYVSGDKGAHITGNIGVNKIFLGTHLDELALLPTEQISDVIAPSQ